MVKSKDTALPVEIRRALESVTQWRSTRTKLSKMPEPLWAQAAAAARIHGVSRVASVLHLGYAALKKRAADSSAEREAAIVKSGFVELTGAELLGSVVSSEATVEILQPDGSRMLLRVPSGHTLDVASVVSAFGARP